MKFEDIKSALTGEISFGGAKKDKEKGIGRKECTGFNFHFTKLQFGIEQRISLYQKISSFLGNGVPLSEIVENLMVEYYNSKKTDLRVTILSDVSYQMGQGVSFNKALSKWVPKTEAMIINSSEAGGDIKEAFTKAIFVTNSVKEIYGTVMGGLAYPAFLFAASIGMLFFYGNNVLPPFAEMLEVEKWPNAGQNLYNFTMFVMDNFMIISIVTIVTLTIITASLSRWVGKSRERINKIPPYSTYRSFQSSTFLVTLGALMETGTPFFESLNVLRDGSSKYVGYEIDKMLLRLKKTNPDGSGNNELKGVGHSLTTNFLDKEAKVDVSIYSRVANLEAALITIGSNAIKETIAGMKKITKLLFGLSLFCVGGYLIWAQYSISEVGNAMSKVGGF